jgi:UDP-N-acetylglucosamine--N-acetylmuramyl-(pentapeptide) pyrophosphoryl-undecaprenol N-acetylglucosamine transferase
VVFVGAQGGIEEKVVPRAGYLLELLKLGALKGLGFRGRLRTLLRLPPAFLRCLVLLLSFRPAAVVGVGGYASGPLVLVAALLAGVLRIRVGILEQNAVPGFTNRVLGRFAHFVLSAFPGVEGFFPPGRVRVTGNPIRSVMLPMESAPREPFTIFVFGGSQGAVGINSLVIGAIEAFQRQGGASATIRWIHQTGEKDYARVLEAHTRLGTGARVEKFIHDMPACYREASLLICRAGSSTLSEIAAVGRAAILVPFPQASDDHQRRNAELFVARGAARLLPQLTSRGEDLAAEIRQFIENPAELAALERAVRELHRPGSAEEAVRVLSSDLSAEAR